VKTPVPSSQLRADSLNLRGFLRALCASAFSALMFSFFPAPAQAQTYAIRGATIHTMAGDPIRNGTVVISNGKIAAVGANVSIPGGAQVINAAGLHVYPGLMDAVSQLGLVEIPQGAAGTVDLNELGDWNPHIMAASAVHPPSELIPVARANGVTHTLSVPGGGVISGQGVLMHLAGWVMDEMAIRRAGALVVQWPTLSTGGGFGGFGFGGARRRPFNEVKQEYDRRVQELADWLDRARHYQQALEKGSQANFERNLKLEGLLPYLQGKLPVLVHANDHREIKDAVEFCEKHKLKMILARGREAPKVAALLKEKNIPVILGAAHQLPASEDEPYDQPFSIAGQLYQAGVKVAVATFDTSDVRTLPYEAANYVPFGLPREEALRAITVNPAQFFGIADQLGTIEAGKLGNLIVTTGDPLEITTQVRYLFIAGKLTSLDNKHRQLYEKYLARP
jgi:imidazolonepropionase-like amidohydrolase